MPKLQSGITVSGVKFRLLFFAAVSFAFAVGAQPQEKAAESPPSQQPSASPAIQEIGNGIFQIGKIRLDKGAQTVMFPASFNMDEGAVEYLLVAAGGKTHESVFVTDVAPQDLHVAMLLLGVKDNSKRGSEAATPPETIDGAWLKNAPELSGEKVWLSVNWKEGDTAKRANAEDFLFNSKAKTPMSREPWLYTGSMLVNGKFLAQEERSVAALVIDPAALINNPRQGNRDDSIWEIGPKKTPPIGTPVEFVIKLAQ